ncbi:hypothetical protein [Sabulibacter ruber]|uniref:hypothetical protein n=1 Tax=Sabulibacter ruber TaxID=2811901 RepID=UPI001A968DCF|nr:hypothetical protein [Sabulibacter ruber]
MKRQATLLQQTSLYEITLFSYDHILQLTWNQPPSTLEYQNGSLAFLELVRELHIKRLISDCSKRGNPTPQDLLWLSHQVVPFLCEHEIQQLALVVPEDPHHARNLESCLMTSQVCYDLQFFHAPTDALDWIRHSPSPFRGKAVA